MEITVLAVDDSKSNLSLLESIFEAHFPEVSLLLAESGEKALFMLKKESVDLMILDINMPGLNGFETAKLVKRNPDTKDIPIIFFTATYKKEEFQKHGFRLGAVDYLIKSVDQDQMINRLSLYIRLFHQNKKIREQNVELDRQKSALKLSNQKLQLAQHISRIGFFEKELQSGKTVYSDELRTLFGPELFSTGSFETVFQSQSLKHYMLAVDRLTATGKTFELDLITQPSGDEKIIHSYGKMVYDKQRQPFKIVVIFQDITELKNAEDELRQKEQIIMAQSRQAAMGEMISMIAHQWRQPISVIGMCANNVDFDITMEALEPEKVKEQVDMINEQVHYLSKTIDDFSSFLKPNQSSESKNISTIAESALNIVREALEYSNITLVTDYRDDMVITSFPSDIIQVLINLLKNAQDIFAARKREEGTITLTTAVEEESVTIRVCDDAGGIPDELLDEIFIPYFSTKEEKNGAGLGLYMSKMIVQQRLKGSLVAENVAGGACFTLRIPPSL